MNQTPILVFDFETGGLDPGTLEPLQIAGVVLDPRSLREVDHFSSYMRPLDFGNLHPEAMKVNKIPLKTLENAPEQRLVWEQFAGFVKKHTKGGFTKAPIPFGKNIKHFDLPISDRLCRTYGFVDKNGEPNIFNKKKRFELEDILWLWFESTDELPDYKMDTVRDYLGIPKDGGHDALVDSRHEAAVLVRFMRLFRGLRPKIGFKGSMAGAC